MNRLEFLLLAKTQYNIQSPFLFRLYSDVISPRLSRQQLRSLSIKSSDRYSQLRFKLCDHLHLSPAPNTSIHGAELFLMSDGSSVGLIQSPHRSSSSESEWKSIVRSPDVTLTVDLFYAGLFFTSAKLSKQHFLLR